MRPCTWSALMGCALPRVAGQQQHIRPRDLHASLITINILINRSAIFLAHYDTHTHTHARFARTKRYAYANFREIRVSLASCQRRLCGSLYIPAAAAGIKNAALFHAVEAVTLTAPSMRAPNWPPLHVVQQITVRSHSL